MTAVAPVPVIAIDGPTASGKGTVARLVAQKLGWHLLDSGALYRLTALSALRRGASTDDEAQLAELARSLPVWFQDSQIFFDSEDVTDAIRAEEIGVVASRIAVLGGVRAALLERQRAYRRLPGLVADGRDMGSVVFPDARLKVFLTASVESRAERRYKQLIEKGFSANFDSLLRELRGRDARDQSPANAPLVAAQGAVVIDSSLLSVLQTVSEVMNRWTAVAGSASEV